MNKNTGIIIGVIALVVVVGGIYVSRSNKEDRAMMQKDAENDAKLATQDKAMEKSEVGMMGALVYNFTAQNNSGETGTITFSEASKDTTNVVIALSGAPKDVSQPAHIHIGSCKSLGSPSHPLTNVVNGKSVTVLNISYENLWKEVPFAVNVHKSSAEVKIYTACTDVTHEGEMMKKEDTSMMDKGDTMMKAGSYEAYSPEKVMLASATHDVILFFKASWCPTCRAVDADIKANLGKIPSGLAILDVNYDDSTALKQKYGVTYQHTFVQVDKDGTLIKKWSGSPTLTAIVAEVK
jgi:thiol-disulfide isomerase/thioredoxin